MGNSLASARLDAIGVPNALSFSELVGFAEKYRGNPVQFISSDFLTTGDTCGAWLSARDQVTRARVVDLLVYPSGSTMDQALSTSMHELGHVFELEPNEDPAFDDDPRVVELLSQYLPMNRLVPSAAHRPYTFSDPAERQVERMGDDLVMRLLRGRRHNRPRDFGFDQVFTS